MYSVYITFVAFQEAHVWVMTWHSSIVLFIYVPSLSFSCSRAFLLCFVVWFFHLGRDISFLFSCFFSLKKIKNKNHYFKKKKKFNKEKASCLRKQKRPRSGQSLLIFSVFSFQLQQLDWANR